MLLDEIAFIEPNINNTIISVNMYYTVLKLHANIYTLLFENIFHIWSCYIESKEVYVCREFICVRNSLYTAINLFVESIE